MKIKILGSKCVKCKVLYERTEEVIKENNIDATLEKVEDIAEVMSYNIFSTPAIVINEKVISKGFVPTKQEIQKLIEREIQA